MLNVSETKRSGTYNHFIPNPKELTTICAKASTTLLYLRTAILLWNRILFIELLIFYLMFTVILLHIFTQKHLLYLTSASIHL